RGHAERRLHHHIPPGRHYQRPQPRHRQPLALDHRPHPRRGRPPDALRLTQPPPGQTHSPRSGPLRPSPRHLHPHHGLHQKEPRHQPQRHPTRNLHLHRNRHQRHHRTHRSHHPHRQLTNTSPGRESSLPSTSLTSPPKKRHFDRSCSQPHREQRSGEICFSTSTVRLTHTTQLHTLRH